MPEIKKHTEFDVKLLHKKIGQLIVIEPTESDIQEGNFNTQIWLVDQNREWWLIGYRRK